MRKGILTLILALAFVSGSNAANHRVLSWDDTGVTVEFTTQRPEISRLEDDGSSRLGRVRLPGFPPQEVEGAPLLPGRRFLFEVPFPRGVELDVLDTDVYPIEGVLPEIFYPESGLPDDQLRRLTSPDLEVEEHFASLFGVGTFRHRYIAFVDISPILFDKGSQRLMHARRIVLRLSFPPAPGSEGGGAVESPHDHLIVNREQAMQWRGARPVPAPSQRTPFEFAKSDNWIRMKVRENGFYVVTYNDLLTAGVNPDNIEVASLRLFSSAPIQQPDSVNHGGSFSDDYHLVEHPLIIKESGFWEGDSIIFYGVGVEGWMNCLDPGRKPTDHYEHFYETDNVYWLTWGGSIGGEPLRMGNRSVDTGGAAPDLEVSAYDERLHVEKDQLYDPIQTDDKWYWRRMDKDGATSFTDYFYLTDLPGGDEGGRGLVSVLGYGPYSSGYVQNSARCLVNGLEVGKMEWIVTPGAFTPDTLEKEVSNLVEGRNTFLVYRNPDNAMYILWYEISYRRRLKAASGMLDFFAPETTGSARFTLTGFPQGDVMLFDVTYYENPVVLTGWRMDAGELVFDDYLDRSPRHYMAVAASAVKKPTLEVAGTPGSPLPSLRDDPVCPDMIIVYHERFRDAALALKAHRSKHLPYAAAPVVKAVDVRDVYSNFSGGLKDPMATRNYCKFLYDNFDNGQGPDLKYILLIGNGTYDSRDVLGRGTDFIPFYINRFYCYYNEGIEDDDFLVKLDEGADKLPDLAIGRLTVLTEREADMWVERIIDYETDPELGAWKNKIVLVTDDEFGTRRKDEYLFLIYAEALSSKYGVVPRFMDIEKIYLHHYPFVGGIKPGAQRDLIKEWSDGALIVNYCGHGSEVQMADELVMVKSDIYSLTNGSLRPLFLSFSCSVGDLESPYQRSLVQELVVYDAGGAIASISALAPTVEPSNSELNYVIYDCLFTSRDSTGSEPIGYALQLAKMSERVESYWRNNTMYEVVGDPAFTLALPAYKVEHDIEAIDTMYTGRRYRVGGSITAGGELLASFNGTAEVVVQEAEEKISQVFSNWPLPIKYNLHGNELFRGTVDVIAGRFTAEFAVPLRCRTGPDARIRSYLHSSSIDGVGTNDTLLILPTDSVPHNDGPPDVRMYFAGQATKVKQGAKLIAEISDSDGIAILGADPQSSIFLEFDGSGYPIFVTDYFEYDHGSSTTGKVEYPLHSGFDPGPHTVILRAFDNLGQSAIDTLDFHVVEEGIYTVSDVFNFPNPFSESTNFVFQVSSPAEMHLSVFNLSGVTIWEESVSADEGFNSVYWDGRDFAGDKLANGTYLYVMEVEFKNSFNRSETIKGKVVLLR